MIVPMKRVTVLCLQEQRESALEALRGVGLVHAQPLGQTAGATDTASLQQACDTVSDLLGWLSAQTAHAAAPAGLSSDDTAETVLGQLTALRDEQRELNEALTVLEAEQLRMEPFGAVDPAQIDALSGDGLAVTLFRADLKHELPEIEKGILQILSEDASGRYGVIVGEIPPQAELTHVALPEHATKERETRIHELDSRREVISAHLVDLCACRPVLDRHLHTLTERLTLAEVRDGMGTDRSIAYLVGYCPEPDLLRLSNAAQAHGWGLLVEDPAEDEGVPTLLEHPAWVRPIKAVFDMLGIAPGYREADIGAVFLAFFSVFFGILIGDAGYGALFLVATLLLRRKFRDAPSYPFTLFKILSIATIIWGVITANYFGIEFELLPKSLQNRQIGWLTVQSNIMGLCFLIGAMHLSVAHLWNAVVLFPHRKAYAQAGWLCMVWTMYFVACSMVLQVGFPLFATVIGIVGLLLIMAFMTDPKDFKRDWIDHAMLPLSLVSCLVDVISYIRLFAVGMATVKVAASFNDMAMKMELPLPLKVLAVALILLLGHGLNIVLGALGILVHAVRLNTLEFSQHKGLSWAGIAYKPFKKTTYQDN